MKEFIDSTIFLGMNSKNEKIRVASKNFFASRIYKKIFMPLEEVGRCDDIIWKFPRKEQDDYYPFMDNIHSVMKIIRISYGEAEIKKSRGKTPLLLAMVKNKKGNLYTFDKNILKTFELAKKPSFGEEKSFPPRLEKLYKKSLGIRI